MLTGPRRHAACWPSPGHFAHAGRQRQTRGITTPPCDARERSRAASKTVRRCRPAPRPSLRCLGCHGLRALQVVVILVNLLLPAPVPHLRGWAESGRPGGQQARLPSLAARTLYATAVARPSTVATTMSLRALGKGLDRGSNTWGAGMLATLPCVASLLAFCNATRAACIVLGAVSLSQVRAVGRWACSLTAGAGGRGQRATLALILAE